MKQHYLHFREVASDGDGDIGVLRYTLNTLGAIVQHEEAQERMKKMLEEHFDADVQLIPRLQAIVNDVYATHKVCKYNIEVDTADDELYWADIEVRITSLY